MQVERKELSQEHTKLKDLTAALQSESAKREAADGELRQLIVNARQDEAVLRGKLEQAEKEKQDLLVQLTKTETDKTSLSQQVRKHMNVYIHGPELVKTTDIALKVQLFYAQAVALAAEADATRKAKISELSPPVAFVDKSFQPGKLLIVDPQAIIRILPQVSVYWHHECQ